MRLAKITSALVALVILAGFTLCAFKSGAVTHDLNFETPKLQSTEAKLKTINIKYEKLNSKLNQKTSNDQKTIEELKQQQEQLQKEREDLKQQVQAKAEEKERLRVAAANAADALTATSHASAQARPSAPVSSSGCGDNSYANYIYMHESGCSTTVRNSEGCMGIGQACPASKLLAVCPNADYACENAFFTKYANDRYGGWSGAYQFWLQNHWW